MEPITVPFTRGGMPFEGIATAKTSVIRDLTPDARVELGYKAEILKFIVSTEAEGQQPSIQIIFRIGKEAVTGVMLEAYEDVWQFDESHPDFEYFMNKYGFGFMLSAINGYVKHYMPKAARYMNLQSNFGQVFNDLGQYLAENND